MYVYMYIKNKQYYTMTHNLIHSCIIKIKTSSLSRDDCGNIIWFNSDGIVDYISRLYDVRVCVCLFTHICMC